MEHVLKRLAAISITMTRTIGLYVEGNCGKAPTVNLTAPANNASACVGTAINVTATATDTDGTILKVDFYNGTTLLGTDNTAPYSFTYTPATAGTLSLRAVATDNTSAAGTSATNTFTVKSIANGCCYKYCRNRCTIILNATTGSGYTYQWEKGTADINGATAATYAAAGADRTPLR